jgi:RNA polymerase subunit RPABC4/transcription elongation factor Spt4
MSATEPADPAPPLHPHGTVRCIACRAEIDAEARLCPVCKSYQQNWKNLLPYLGSAAGLIAIIASAITFISGNAYDWFKVATWKDDVAIAYFEYPGQSGFINTGDGAIVLSSVFVQFDPQSDRAINIPLHQQIEAGKFAVVSTQPLYVQADGIDHATWAKNADGTLNRKLLDDASNYANTGRCADYHLYNAEHLVFRVIDAIQRGRRLISGKVAAQLNFVSLHTGKQISRALGEMRVAFLFMDRKDCPEKAYGILP